MAKERYEFYTPPLIHGYQMWEARNCSRSPHLNGTTLPNIETTKSIEVRWNFAGGGYEMYLSSEPQVTHPLPEIDRWLKHKIPGAGSHNKDTWLSPKEHCSRGILAADEVMIKDRE